MAPSSALSAILATPQPPVILTRLNAKCSLYTPPSSVPGSGSPADPTTILFIPWMDAAPKHIDKYIAIHAALYPRARILVATITTTDFFFVSASRRSRDLSPILTALHADPSPHPKLLVHVFSNGGVKTLYTITQAYRTSTHCPLPAKLLVVDSAPGLPHFWRDVHVLTRTPPQNLVLFSIVYVLVVLGEVFLMFTYHCTPFLRDLSRGPREAMVDETLVEKGHANEMLFLYSKEDKPIYWKDVEMQAKNAEEKGWVVQKEMFKGSEHVGHMRIDPQRYWVAVAEAWEKVGDDK